MTLSTSGLSVSTVPTTVPRPETMFNTPSGRPACRNSPQTSATIEFVSSAGLQTIVQPTASAGAILKASIMIGKFHGTIAATTPTGSRATTASYVPDTA